MTIISGQYGLSKFGEGHPEAGIDTFTKYVDESPGGPGSDVDQNDLNHLQDAIKSAQREILFRLDSIEGTLVAHSYDISLLAGSGPPYTTRFYYRLQSRIDDPTELNYRGLYPYYNGTNSQLAIFVPYKFAKDNAVLVVSSVIVTQNDTVQSGWSLFVPSPAGYAGTWLGAQKSGVQSIANGGYDLHVVYSVTGD